MDESRRMVALDEVPEDGSLLFTVAGSDERTEGILFRLADGVVAYENYCQHWTDVRLDSGSGAALRNDEIVCEKHGAYFEADSGYCNFGPCEGSVLEEIDVTVAEDAVYLTDDRFAFEKLGPAGDTDPSSGNRIGFSGT